MTSPVSSLPIPFIDVSGTPGERGHAYGRAAADRVLLGVEQYRQSMQQRGVAWPQALAAARLFFEEVAALEPALAEELRAIAEGAGAPLEGVLIINARSEILHRLGGSVPAQEDDGSLDDGCTGVIVLPEATADGRLIHAQNWDWMIAARDTSVVLRVRDGDHELLTFVEAGGLARCGLNSAGIALTGNSLRSNVPMPERALPISLIRRKVLAATTIQEGLNAIYRSPRGCSNNMMLSHVEGDAIDVETTPDQIFWLRPEAGLLVHANHFRHLSALARFNDLAPPRSAGTLMREGRLERLLQARHGSITVTDVARALLDPWGAPNGILSLPSSEEDGVSTGTTASIIMVPERGELLFCIAPDQDPTYHRVSLSQPVASGPAGAEPVFA